jgi:hypothetical protein
VLVGTGDLVEPRNYVILSASNILKTRARGTRTERPCHADSCRPLVATRVPAQEAGAHQVSKELNPPRRQLPLNVCSIASRRSSRFSNSTSRMVPFLEAFVRLDLRAHRPLIRNADGGTAVDRPRQSRI